MARYTYHPDRGDFVHLNFSPSAGHEQTAYRYGIVLSTAGTFAQSCAVRFGMDVYQSTASLADTLITTIHNLSDVTFVPRDSIRAWTS